MIESPFEFVLGLLAGAFLGVVVDEVLGAPVRRAIRWFPRWRRIRVAQAWSGPNRDAVEVFQTWSSLNVLLEEHVVEHWDPVELERMATFPGRDPLLRERLRSIFSHPDYFDDCVAMLEDDGPSSVDMSDLDKAADDPAGDDMRPFSGAPEFSDSWVASLSTIVPRWRESLDPSRERLHLHFTPVRYVDTFAVGAYARKHRAEWAEWQEAIWQPRTGLPVVPPGTFFVSISVTSAEGKLLAWRRSGNVHTARGQWTIGTDETMKPPIREAGQAPSTLFELARRSLREEVGLEPEDYGDGIFFSSIGVRRGSFHLPRLAIGHVWSELAAAEIEAAWLRSESANEHSDLTWIPADEPSLRRVAASGTVTVGGRQVGPNWLYTNWLLAVGRWAVRDPASGRP